jgi:rhodanese-related sulfurtransferase/DNA-binding transcriptional ArsR family regulator
MAFSPKRELFDHFARIGKAVGSPARLELLDLLAQGEKPVETLARQAGLSVTNTSNHLKELRAASLVSTRKDGPYVFYRLADPSVQEFLRSLQALAHRQLSDVRQIVQDYFERPDDLEAVEGGTLLDRIRAGEVVVLDVRPEDEYLAGHIPGARSVPLPQLEGSLSDLPAGAEVVAYCRGPYCVLAPEAVALLRARGFRARRLAEGLPDWAARGLPVATGRTD